MKTFLITILFALPVFAVFAQADGDYDQLIVDAGSSLKAGQLDQARQDVQEAIKLNATNYMAYVIAAKIAAKQNDIEEANNFAQKALELAPDDDKDKVRQFANELQSAATTPVSPTTAPATTSTPLSDDDQLKHDGLMQILDDASKSNSDDDRKDSFRQFLTRSVDFADAHPDQLDIWVGRAYAAMQLDYPDTGWLAGKRLRALGAIRSNDPKVHDVMVHLESKGWLDSTQPQRDWSKWTTDQALAAANQGDACAQNALGDWYKNGQSNLSQDYAQAVSWYQKAAVQGQADAENNLGIMYQNGRGVAQDYTQALAWYEKSAGQGYSGAQCALGVIYQSGQGVPQDYVQALNWYQKSAAQGNAVAQDDLGAMYEEGLGVATNYDEAVNWYRKAAEHGALRWGHHGLVWLLATCNDPNVRDGREAVQYTERIIQQGFKSAAFLDDLAAGYAEEGDFDKAISTENEAIALLTDNASMKDYNSRLSLYESHTPCRQP